MHQILLIYNRVEGQWLESSSGVLEQLSAVKDALESLGFPFKTVEIHDLSHLARVLRENPHPIVFNLIEEFADGIDYACYVPAFAAAFGKVCTGNSTSALLLAQNKWLTKIILLSAGIPVPQGICIPVGRELAENSLPDGRYIIKPALSDASEGIDSDSVIDLPDAGCSQIIERIHYRLKQPALVEEYIPAREFNIALMQSGDKLLTLPVAEIDLSGLDTKKPAIIDYQAKWVTDSFSYQNTPRIIPADLDEKIAQKIRQYAVRSWGLLGCSDYARVDFRMDERGKIYVLEVNPNPDISPDAGFAAALKAQNITYKDFIKNVIRNAQKICENYIGKDI